MNWKLLAVLLAGGAATYFAYRMRKVYAWIVAAATVLAVWWVTKHG